MTDSNTQIVKWVSVYDALGLKESNINTVPNIHFIIDDCSEYEYSRALLNVKNRKNKLFIDRSLNGLMYMSLYNGLSL